MIQVSEYDVRESSIMIPNAFDVATIPNLEENLVKITTSLSGAEAVNLEHSSKTAHQVSASDQPCKESLMEHCSNMLFSREPIRKSDPTDSGQSTVAYQQRALSAPSTSLQSTKFPRSGVSVVRLCMRDGQDFRSTGWC